MNEKPESWLKEANPRAGVLTEPPGATNESSNLRKNKKHPSRKETQWYPQMK